MAKKDTIEEAISMLVRVSERMSKDGVQLGFTMTWSPVAKPPTITVTPPPHRSVLRRKGVARSL